ncbi:TPA: conjugal transfer entry exclusion protein TraS [Escherichia coli]|nr:conjugal transfer entry exclusion protein TraS [Escherichia coli]
MITHYDIKMEMQKLKEVLSVEGVNIPSLLQVIKPGTYVFLWILLWPTFLRLVSVKSDVRDVGFDICASVMMGFLLFVAITNGMMLYLAIPDSFRKDSKIINFMYSKSKTYILLFLIVFSMVSFMHSILYVFALMITFILFFLVYTIDINRYNLSAIASVRDCSKKSLLVKRIFWMKTKKLMMVALVSSTLALSGCGAMSTAIKKRNLEVKTQMSETIWLEPASERTVFLQIKNTSDKDMSGLQGKIADAVKAKGYQVVTSPDKAYYWIQANVLKADKMDLRESQGWLNRGYEGAAVGAALGAGITGYNSSSAGATLGVGLAAGLVGMAADAMVEDVNYTMITDVQIAERTKATVTTDNVAALRQGTSGAKIQTSTETGNQHKYQTRVVSNANKVNLKFEEAKPVLEDQLAKSIANIL